MKYCNPKYGIVVEADSPLQAQQKINEQITQPKKKTKKKEVKSE